MKSILHITALALRGGCEKNCYHFIEGSPQFNHEIIVLGEMGPMTAQWKALGIETQHLNILQSNLIEFYRLLKKNLTGRSFDMVICWSTIRLPLQLNILNNVTKEIRVHLGNPLGLGYNDLKDRVLAFLLPVKAPVKLMACSVYVADSHASDGYFQGFPMDVSLNPVTLPATYPQKHLSENEFNLGMVARLDPIKDHQTVLSGFKEILKQIPNAKLHLVGGGILKEKLQQEAVDENIATAVYFHGDVDNVYEYLNEWDVFVYATTLSEGLGSVVAEAMANGLPCVLSELPMLQELAPKDGLVLWFKAGDPTSFNAQVQNIYADKSLRAQIGNAAFQYAQENFGVKRFIDDYIK